MTDKQILTKAIEKAIANGFKSIDVHNFDPTYFKIKQPTVPKGWPWYLIRWTDSESGQDTEVNIEHVLFDHDFAKALWGADTETDWLDWDERAKLELVEDQRPPKYLWQWHLQRMVIADDPIKYLGENFG